MTNMTLSRRTTLTRTSSTKGLPHQGPCAPPAHAPHCSHSNPPPNKSTQHKSGEKVRPPIPTDSPTAQHESVTASQHVESLNRPTPITYSHPLPPPFPAPHEQPGYPRRPHERFEPCVPFSSLHYHGPAPHTPTVYRHMGPYGQGFRLM
eukprot:GHVN01063371.1.p1 GENE.GHVN01063371.1~~GHVN01063371.1.p1  ORF type:complete len:149 (+),score=9.93 GHVN01063371.1:494-940(+)